MKRRRSFAPRYPARLTLPVLAYDAVFFLGPLAILIVFSLAKTVGFGQVSYALSGGNFRQLWDSLYLDIFKTTLEMATIGTVLTLLVGYPMAYWMARCLTTGKSLALILVIIPFLTSFLIRTYAWFIILDPQGYLVARGARPGLRRLAAALLDAGDRHRVGLRLHAAADPARLRLARAHGLEPRRCGARSRILAVQGVPPDHDPAHACPAS